MSSVLTIGGARFMGRFTVEQYLDRGHDVTIFSRGNTPLPFDDAEISHITGDRQHSDELEAAYDESDPDIVIDFAAFHPDDVRAATEIFDDVGRYVYISSTHAYQRTATIPLREDVTPLEEFGPDDDDEYGPCKAEGDRILFDAAENGMNAISVRPTAIYGPYDPTARQDYWFDRINRYDRIVVPGDEYRMPIHLGYVEDAARAIRLVADQGEPGESYNIASRTHITFDEFVELAAAAMDTSVEIVHATPTELAAFDLTVPDFTLIEPYPYLVSTAKLASLGWSSTSFEEGIPVAVDEHLESDRTGEDYDIGREQEEAIIEACE